MDSNHDLSEHEKSQAAEPGQKMQRQKLMEWVREIGQTIVHPPAAQGLSSWYAGLFVDTSAPRDPSGELFTKQLAFLQISLQGANEATQKAPVPVLAPVIGSRVS